MTLLELENKENIVIDIEKGALNTKPNKPISINVEGSYKDTPLNINATVKNVSKLLITNKLSGMPVIDAKGHLAGFVSERDIIKAICKGFFKPFLGYFGLFWLISKALRGLIRP